MAREKQNILIRGARVIDPYNNLDNISDIYISNGIVISGPGEPEPKSFSADKEIDSANKILMPSIVDTNVHLREPGFERKASIKSELKAAAASGIGHLACLPTCEPTIDTASLAKSIIHKANSFNLSKVYPIGALTKGLEGSQLSEMKSLSDANCVALTNYYEPIKDLSILRRCYEYAATFDILVFIYPQML